MKISGKIWWKFQRNFQNFMTSHMEVFHSIQFIQKQHNQLSTLLIIHNNHARNLYYQQIHIPNLNKFWPEHTQYTHSYSYL